MADPNPNEIAPEERAVEGYVGNVETVALLILGGVDPKKLQEWYPDISDDEISQAQKKIEHLKLEGGE